jgi:CBS domain containing-hemolysin-like protein
MFVLNILYIIVASGLVLLNSFFVAAEFGMVKLRHTRVEAIHRRYGIRGRILLQIHKNLDSYLSACQLGITLASLGLGWVGEPAFADLLEPAFATLGIVSPDATRITSYVVAFSFITFLHIVIGELVPKSIAIRQSERISIWTSVPLYLFYWFMYPAIWFLNACANFLLKIMHLDIIHKGEHAYSPDEIKRILHTSHLYGEFSREESRILEHALEFYELNVTAAMRPIDAMVVVNLQDPLKKSLQTMNEHRYTRYPVYDKEKNTIIGVVHVKDLFFAHYKRKLKDLNSLVRPVLKVYQKYPASDLLDKFREGMPHFALVYNEKDELIGFVTLDNLLHVLLGRIKDEFHRTRDDWTLNSDGSFTFNGSSSIYALERALDIDIPLAEEKVETISGYILTTLDRVPKKGEYLEFDLFNAVIEKMRGAKILSVRIYPKKKPRHPMSTES